MLNKLIFLSLPILLFSTEINFTKSFTKKVSSDELTTKIAIKLQGNDEDDIVTILEKYNDLIKSDDTIRKEKGLFSINPRYKIKNNKSTIVGYNGILSYNIFTKKSTTMNAFIKELLYAKDEPEVNLQISNMHWIISDTLNDEVTNKLRLKMITWSKQYANQLSSELGTVCTTKKIDLNQNFSYKKRRNLKATNKALPIPKNTNNQISIRADYTMDCI